MIVYLLISIVSGFLFGVMDGLIHANAFAQRLYVVYKPIARKTLNMPVGILIDVAYGFLMAGCFILLSHSLPGEIGIVKGISYGIIVWFFRVVMSVISTGMMYNVPIKTLLYTLFTGLSEMLILGVLYGLTITP
jgi:hypothetical protein